MYTGRGLPHVVSGAALVSEEFKIFLQRNGIRLVFVLLHNSSSNGATKSVVRKIKQKFKEAGSGDLYAQITKPLLSYWTTPPKVTDGSPVEHLSVRKPKTIPDSLQLGLRGTIKTFFVTRGSTRIIDNEP